MLERSVDLQTKANEILDGEVATLEEKMDEMAEKLVEEYGDFSSVPASKQQAFEELEARAVEKRGKAYTMLRYTVAWGHEYQKDENDVDNDWLEEHRHEDLGDSVFVLKELTTGEFQSIQDEVTAASVGENGEEAAPKVGVAKTKVLEASIKRQPDGAPTQTDRAGRDAVAPGKYPNQIGEYLFEKVNNLSTTGEVDMGNSSSLRERMKSYDTLQASSSTGD